MHPDNLRDLTDAVVAWNAATITLRKQLDTLQVAMAGDIEAVRLRVLDAKLAELQEISSGTVVELAKQTPENA